MAEAQSRILNVNEEIEKIVDRVERQALGITALIVRSINAPLRELERSMSAITQGRLDVPIPRATRDEIGGMTRALAMLRDSLIESHRLEHLRQRAEADARRAQAQLGEAIEAISEDLRSTTWTTGWSSATAVSRRCTRASPAGF